MNPALLLALLALALASCKQRPPLPAANSTAAEPSAPNVPTMAEQVPKFTPTEAIIIPESPDPSATLGELSAALRAYVSNTRSAPKDFQDFVARAHVTSPAPPPGKEYAISAGQVVLVSAKK